MKKELGILVLVIVLAGVAISYYYGFANTAPSATVTTKSLVTYTSSNSMSSRDWPTYHGDLSRSGSAPDVPSYNSAHLSWRSVTLDGDVYAEPLIVGNNVLIATENDSLYDLDAVTGQVIWRTHLGTPVNGSDLPCGDINPSGVTGTPVVDVSTGIVYVAAFLSPPHHELFAVDLSTGSIRSAVLADAPGMNPMVEQQRAALALSAGNVYVAYGGLAGDCGAYHGWVVAVETQGRGQLSKILSYQVPSVREAGIWAPSGPAVDSSGELFVATGNSGSTAAFDFGNSVIKLSPNLKPLDWFAPTNWIQLNDGDGDLGSTGPLLLNSTFIFQIGKDGIGYLLNAKKLGGIGGELLSGRVCNGAYGGLAYASPYVFVPCTDGIVALQVDLGSKPSFRILWRGPSFVPGPPVVAGHAVWTVDVNDGLIYAFDISNGQMLFQDHVGKVTHFTSLAIGKGQVIVSGNRQVLAFSPVTINQQQSSQSYFADVGSALKMKTSHNSWRLTSSEEQMIELASKSLTYSGISRSLSHL
jgi:outer membrane protein assembly factor BamB